MFVEVFMSCGVIAIHSITRKQSGDLDQRGVISVVNHCKCVLLINIFFRHPSRPVICGVKEAKLCVLGLIALHVFLCVVPWDRFCLFCVF